MLDTVLWSAGAFAVMILVLVTVHEYGHFQVARWCGVKVLCFSVGFGPKLLRHTARDGVEYTLSAIPLGGYTKMLGEGDEVEPADRARAFRYQATWKRVLIALAGPGANVLLAIVLYAVAGAIGLPGLKPILGVPAAGTAAAHAQLQAGDTVTAVGDHSIRSWQALRVSVLGALIEDLPLQLTVHTAAGIDRRVALDFGHITVNTSHPVDALGLQPDWPTVPAEVDHVLPNSPAARAGLRAGDRITAVDGTPVHAWKDLVKATEPRPGQRITLTVQRDGATLQIPVAVGSRHMGQRTVGFLGVAARVPSSLDSKLFTHVRYGPIDSIGHGLGETWRMSKLTVLSLWQTVTGHVSVKKLSGPLGIAHMGDEAAHEGFAAFLSFLAFISINLGILNLLPIPVLDGGQVVAAVVEGASRHQMSKAIQAAWVSIGLTVIIAVTILAFYNDIARLS
ncbi:MAG TPA: RIP metalloprotease RseP [Nevskiaceae bacterium]|nr:RIP metalloprotease RseP [Nevskiaceae bacterium]